jgi:GR25 family glycosyltransferase involved in LPS biosynthesis
MTFKTDRGADVMECVYINLDNAAARREAIEGSFQEHNSPGWILKRFPAIDVGYVKQNSIAGRIRDEEKGCFLSHKIIIERSVDLEDHLFILEDDVCFGRQSMAIVDNLVNNELPEDTWDLLFTDVGIPSIYGMLQLIDMRNNFRSTRSIQTIDLMTMIFFGSTCYIINKNAIRKLNHILDKATLDAPYDLYLRELIQLKLLRAFVIFPFLTSVSNESSKSGIQTPAFGRTQFIWNIFRQMIWIEGDEFDPSEILAKMYHAIENRSKLYGMLFSLMTDPSFPQN